MIQIYPRKWFKQLHYGNPATRQLFPHFVTCNYEIKDIDKDYESKIFRRQQNGAHALESLSANLSRLTLIAAKFEANQVGFAVTMDRGVDDSPQLGERTRGDGIVCRQLNLDTGGA